DPIDDAARALSARKIGGAPVVDDDNRVVGLLEDDDLIVQESRLHFPTVISILGAYLAQGLDGLRAAAGAAFVHGRAGHLGWRHGLVAGDLLDLVPDVLDRR
ncbi:MAG: hypothetical protein QOI56_737, partial [Actinomycetota bacterium]|nr:hypothetical protein [Actinomycetota bacterium]